MLTQKFVKKHLTILASCGNIGDTSKGVYFFVPFFRRSPCQPYGLREVHKFRLFSYRRYRYESQDHLSLHRVQAAQLQHHEEQEERSRQTGNEQVLPFLP